MMSIILSISLVGLKFMQYFAIPQTIRKLDLIYYVNG